jgi:hypothetical protein
VETLSIVAEFDIPDNILSGVFASRVDGTVDPFDFHGGIERFCESVVETHTGGPTDCRMLRRIAGVANAALVYCVPRSVWNIAPSARG